MELKIPTDASIEHEIVRIKQAIAQLEPETRNKILSIVCILQRMTHIAMEEYADFERNTETNLKSLPIDKDLPKKEDN